MLKKTYLLLSMNFCGYETIVCGKKIGKFVVIKTIGLFGFRKTLVV